MTAAGHAAGLTPPQGLAYGLMGLPLAFVALPLYVVLPHHYASEFGVPLASLGLLLLAVRAADAVADPLIGLGVDRLLGAPRRARLLAAGLAAGLLALAFQALFFPAVSGQTALLVWCGAALVGCYAAYSGLSVLHHAWGARLGGDAAQRARVVSWREGAALVGVIVASVLPGTLGLQVASLVLAAALVAGLLGWAAAPSPPPARSNTPPSHPWAPWREPRFRRLLGVYLLNGVASALPATLVLFFIRDRLQWPEGEPVLLGLYFAAAALSLPLWVRVVARIGLAPGWALGMALSILAFVGAVALGPGDGLWFAAVCVASGAALGADLCVPPALLAGLLRDSPAQDEGVAFGWWNAATKLNLALAAGLALPLLQALGYQPGHTGGSGGLALSLVYAALPCALKALALLALWRLWIRKEHPR
ncbi:MAG: MFS transporter [Vitreoscilla sp.]|nr:MFS transporter [Vitreoscilla sp.]